MYLLTLQSNTFLGCPMHPVCPMWRSRWYFLVNSLLQSKHLTFLIGWTFIWSISPVFVSNAFRHSTQTNLSPLGCSILKWRCRKLTCMKSLSQKSHLYSPIWNYKLVRYFLRNHCIRYLLYEQNPMVLHNKDTTAKWVHHLLHHHIFSHDLLLYVFLNPKNNKYLF